jgi:lysophospholipase L1-like esterase
VFIYPPGLFYAESPNSVAEELHGTALGGKNPLYYQMGFASARVRERSFDTVAADDSLDSMLLLDLNPPFRILPLRERAGLFVDQIHPNAAGNRLIARTIRARLTGLNLLPK